MKTIYIEGGSTAYGMFDLQQGGWANRLQVATMREIEDITDPTVVVNHALPGRTLPAIMRDVASRAADYRRYGPVAAVLQVGFNEAKVYPPNTMPIITTRRFGDQLLRFCSEICSGEVSPILVGPQPTAGVIDNTLGTGSLIRNDLIAEYAEVMRTTAAETGTPYVDTQAIFADSLEELLADDGYHPNELGHLVICDAVRGSLRGLEGGF